MNIRRKMRSKSHEGIDVLNTPAVKYTPDMKSRDTGTYFLLIYSVMIFFGGAVILNSF